MRCCTDLTESFSTGELRSSGAGLFGAVLAVALALASAPARASAEPALSMERCVALARSPEWLRLVHYRPAHGGGVESEVDGTEFFLAPDGKTEPVAELEATLRAFRAPVVPGREDDHALCRFPARLFWYNEQLPPEARIKPPACPALARYGAGSVESVSVVYAANSLANPASAFGHTFLRLKRKQAAGGRRLDDWSDYGIEYTAVPDTPNPVLYVVKGLTGMFQGYFRIRSFEFIRREYAENEGRDLWEYSLALTRREVTLLALHLWELSAAHIDFFYLTGNCSFHVLAALEAAAMRLDLLSRVRVPVLPADTIKILVAVPGLVRTVAYRPSYRSRLPAPRDKAPDLQHGAMRAMLGAGETTQYGDAFASLGYRLALHDLLDPPDGFPELTQLQFLDTRIRYDPRRRVLTVDRLTFAEVLALNPLSDRETALSWRAGAFGVRVHDAGCPDCFVHGLEGAVGGTVATDDEHLAVFLMAEAFFGFPADLRGIGGSFARLGVGPYAGLRIRFAGQNVGLLTGAWSYLPAQRPSTTYDLRASLRGQVGKDVALGVEAALQPLSFEAQLGSYVYF